jgi:hypothetical protein
MFQDSYFTSLFHLLGAGGRPPLGGPLVWGELAGGGAGLMGKDMMFCPLDALEVRAGYDGREEDADE